MTDDALKALRSNDRPHNLPPGSYKRIEDAMLDAYLDIEPQSDSDQPVLTFDPPSRTPRQPNKWGRSVWFGIAAGILVVTLATAQLVTSEQSEPTNNQVLGDYCQNYLEPVADALDLLRVNPNQENAAEARRLLGQALTEFERSSSIDVDTSDLTDRYSDLQPSPESSDTIIEIANALGDRVASLTASSPRCDLSRLATNVDRSSDPIGRPPSND